MTNLRPAVLSNRGNRWIWLLPALDLILAGGYVFFALRNGAGRLDWSSLAFSTYLLAGALIIYRQPRNRVGWVLAVFGFFNIFSNFLGEYAFYTLLTRPGSLPFGNFTAWVSSWTWLAAQPFGILAVLLFPNGSPLSRRWWWLIGVVFTVLVPILVFLMVLFWPIRGPVLVLADTQNAMTPAVQQQFLRALTIWEPVYLSGFALGLITLAVRFARSRGIERQQIKWILLVMAIVPVSIGINVVGLPKNNPLVVHAAAALNTLSIIGFPIAMAFAVTRYHLYDIDIIIRRTLVYGALTVTLGLLYFGSVVLLQAAIAWGGLSRSPVIIVLSTLLIAALFSPLRARFQQLIDRRFYRRKYNSEQILERFTAGLRSEVDLQAIHSHLLGMVDESFQPDFSSLWLVAPEKDEQR